MDRSLIGRLHWIIADMRWDRIFIEVDGGEDAVQGKLAMDGWEADFTIEREHRHASYLITIELITMNTSRGTELFFSRSHSLANVMIYMIGWVYMAKADAERS